MDLKICVIMIQIISKSSNLVITLNRFSNSFCRAALFNVPSMALVNSNSIEVRNKNDIFGTNYPLSEFNRRIMRLITRQKGMIKKYLIFPESRIDIMEEFFSKNELYSSIARIFEIFDENIVVENMKKYLFSRDGQLVKAQENFFNKAHVCKWRCTDKGVNLWKKRY